MWWLPSPCLKPSGRGFKGLPEELCSSQEAHGLQDLVKDAHRESEEQRLRLEAFGGHAAITETGQLGHTWQEFSFESGDQRQALAWCHPQRVPSGGFTGLWSPMTLQRALLLVAQGLREKAESDNCRPHRLNSGSRSGRFPGWPALRETHTTAQREGALSFNPAHRAQGTRLIP